LEENVFEHMVQLVGSLSLLRSSTESSLFENGRLQSLEDEALTLGWP